jgi:pyridoxamine 5'-phosphate oxidase
MLHICSMPPKGLLNPRNDANQILETCEVFLCYVYLQTICFSYLQYMQPSEETTTPSLHEIQNEAWALLAQGSQKPGDAFYTGTLGTQAGSGVSLRTVVLREADPVEKILICYSDKRASKIEEIANNPSVSFLFWDSDRKIQFRLTGKATVHTEDPLTDRHWQQASPSNRRSYLAIPAPGSPQPQPGSGLPAGLDTREPTPEESEKGRVNFAVISLQVQHLDWLHLARGGHRRAMFSYKEGKIAEAGWVVP